MAAAKIIGLTGGIGSGKSLIARIFSLMDFPVYNADDQAKKLYLTDPDLRAGVVRLFGEEAYANGSLNRTYLAQIVFHDKKKLAQLNALVHPAVRRHFTTWHKQQDAPFVIREAAILFESGSYKDCYKVITVAAPEELRIHRVKTRDEATTADIEARINKQWSDKQRREKSDFEIVNDDKKLVIPQVEHIVSQLDY